jgi:hypothetical protein
MHSASSLYPLRLIQSLLMRLNSGNDIRIVQIARFLQGAVASTGSIMVGGTIADIWAPEE